MPTLGVTMDFNTHNLDCEYLHTLCGFKSIRLRCVLVDTASKLDWPELGETRAGEAELRMWT